MRLANRNSKRRASSFGAEVYATCWLSFKESLLLFPLNLPEIPV